MLSLVTHSHSLPGWDGYDAKPVSPEAVAAARRLGAALGGRLPPEARLVPVWGGSVQIDCHRGARGVELEFEGEAFETVHYLKWDPEGGATEEGFFPAEDLPRVLELLDWCEETTIA